MPCLSSRAIHSGCRSDGLPRFVQSAKGNECSAYAIKEVRFARRFAVSPQRELVMQRSLAGLVSTWIYRQRLCGELIR
jgi:hypothetical protein